MRPLVLITQGSKTPMLEEMRRKLRLIAHAVSDMLRRGASLRKAQVKGELFCAWRGLTTSFETDRIAAELSHAPHAYEVLSEAHRQHCEPSLSCRCHRTGRRPGLSSSPKHVQAFPGHGAGSASSNPGAHGG